jgi:hypothetical protein
MTTEDRRDDDPPVRVEAGEFPSASCECHWAEPYGFVPEAGCQHHDTAQFLEFVSFIFAKGAQGALAD